MQSLPEQCRMDGCTSPRTRYSVFCETHHEEQLARVGLARSTSDPNADPCAEHVRKCERVLKNHALGLIAFEEVLPQLADLLVQAYQHDLPQCWQACSKIMPAPIPAQLLSYLKSSRTPHGFFLTSRQRIRAAFAAQADLISKLEEHLDIPLADRTVFSGTAPLYIRVALPEDVTDARRLGAAAFAENRALYRPKPTARPVLGSDDPDLMHIVAAEGDAVVGTTAYWFQDGACHLGAVAIDPDHRGRGIGRALVEHVAELWHGCGTSLVATTIRQAGQVGFYERLGFTVVAECEPSWCESVTGEPLTEVELRRSL